MTDGTVLMTLSDRIEELVEKHGSLRATARVLQMDPAYLSRLKNGIKQNPEGVILRRLGLERVVRYRRTK